MCRLRLNVYSNVNIPHTEYLRQNNLGVDKLGGKGGGGKRERERERRNKQKLSFSER